MLLCLLLGLSKIATSDTIILKDGTLHEGTIKWAADSSVAIWVKKKTVIISHSKILSLSFTSADLVHLKSKAVLECKVTMKYDTAYVILTSQGIETIPINQVREIEYNHGYPLKVVKLPLTGSDFKNKSGNWVWAGDFKPNIYFGGRLAGHFPRLKDWKEQFSEAFFTRCPNLNGEIGYAVNRQFNLSVGYDYFFFGPVEVVDSAGYKDRISASFIHGSLKFNRQSKSHPSGLFYGKADFGLLYGTEKVENADGVTLTAAGNTFAYRLSLGIQAFFDGNTSCFFELRYLSAKVSDFRLLGQKIENYSLDFSGLSFTILGFSYHLPVSQ